MKQRLNLPARILVCAALAGSASLAAVVIPGGIASASPLTLSCLHLTGTTTATATSSTEHLSGCSGTAQKLTGTTGTAAVKTNLATKTGTATVTWATKKTSTESYKFTELTGSKNLCSAKTGYSKVAEAKETGSVKGGTATAMKGGAVTATACAYFKGSNHSTIYIFNKGPVKM